MYALLIRQLKEVHVQNTTILVIIKPLEATHLPHLVRLTTIPRNMLRRSKAATKIVTISPEAMKSLWSTPETHVTAIMQITQPMLILTIQRGATHWVEAARKKNAANKWKGRVCNETSFNPINNIILATILIATYNPQSCNINPIVTSLDNTAFFDSEAL